MTQMKVGEYRDLIDQVWGTLNSAKSAATDTELDNECYRLLPQIKELQQAVCPRASKRDKQRAENTAEQARQFCFSSLMYLNDNQRIEAEYLGTPW